MLQNLLLVEPYVAPDVCVCLSCDAGIAVESESDSSEGIKDGEKEERETVCNHQIQTMDQLDDLELQVRAY